MIYLNNYNLDILIKAVFRIETIMTNVSAGLIFLIVAPLVMLFMFDILGYVYIKSGNRLIA